VSGAWRAQAAALAARIDALSLRERAILFVTLLAVLFLIADNLVFPGVRAEHRRLSAEVGAKVEQMRAMNSAHAALAVEAAEDPAAAHARRVAALEARLAAVEGPATELVASLVSPQEMPRLVRQMLARNRGLTVVKVENLPAAPLTAQPAGAAAAPAAVYKHGMRIELRGQYLDMIRYLQDLEGMSWKVLWGEARLDSDGSVSTLSLLFYTLSLDKAWIGV
jgi:MSHA biogenesis protein MshJ